MSPSVPKNFKYSSTAAAGCFVSIMICLKRGREKAWPRKRRARLLRIRFKYVWDPTQRLFRRSPLKPVRGRRVPIGPSCSKTLRTTACPKANRESRLKLPEMKSSTLRGSFMSRRSGCETSEGSRTFPESCVRFVLSCLSESWSAPPFSASSVGADAGISALARYVVPSMSPLWGNLSAASTFLPILTAALSPLTAFIIQAIVLLTVFFALAQRTRASVLLVVAGLVMAGSTVIETIPSWLIFGAATGIVLMLAYLAVFRHQPMVALVTAATLVILSTLRDGIQRPYSTALLGSIMASVLIALAAWVWYRGSATVVE